MKKKLTKKQLSEIRAKAGRKGGLIGGKKGGEKSRGGGRPPKWTEEKIESLRKLHQNGMTMAEIGEKHGISESRVSKLLKK